MKNNKLKPTVKTALVYTLAATSTAAIAYATPKIIENKSKNTENKFVLDVKKVDSDTVKVSLDNIEDIPKALQFSLKLDGIVLKEENGKPVIKDLINPAKSDKIITDYTYNKENNTIDVLITAQDSIPKTGNEIDVFELDIQASNDNSSRKYKIKNEEKSEYKYVSNTNKEYVRSVSVKNEELTLNTNPTVKMKEGKSYIEITEGETIQLTEEVLKEKGLEIKDDENDKITLEVKDASDKKITSFKGTEEGIYDLYITAKDDFGGESKTLNVQLKVNASTVGPTITRDGKALEDVTINAGQAFNLMDSVKAVDVNGNTVNVSVSSDKELNLDTEQDTTYVITYSATDSRGRKTEKTINLTVKGNKAPVIEGVKNHTLKVGDSFDPKAGVTVTDEDENIELVVESNVNTNIPGVYKVIYKATDSGNKTTIVESSVVVNPKMTTLNKIPVINAQDRIVQLGEKFDPLEGVTATDEEDKDLTKSIKVIRNDVNTNVAGDYTVVFSVTDSQGATAIHEMLVVVNQPPVIHAEDRVITVGDEFKELEGVTATDDEQGDITEIKVVENNVKTDTPGEYTVTYKVVDKLGGVATKTIKVTVKEKVTLVENVVINNRVNNLYIGSNQVLSATITNENADKKDVVWTTSDEKIASIEADGNTVKVIAKAKGQVTITAKATDGSEKSDSITIKIQDYKDHVVDLAKDIIDTNVVTPVNGSGQKDSPVQMEVKDVNVKEFNVFLKKVKKLNPEIQREYTDGEFTVYQIKIQNNSLMSKFIRTLKNEETNEAYINIKIKNSVANSEELKSELKKVLTEKDEEIVKPSIPGGIINAIPKIEAKDRLINVGQKFEPLEGVTATDKEDGTITKIDVIENTVNENVAGTYKVTYKVTDSKGAEARKTITVIVNALPVINAEDKVIKVGEDFNPLIGVTATDKEDGAITKIDVLENTVNVNVPGEYKVTYKVTDSKGAESTKTINVTVKKETILAQSVTINNKINSLYVGSNKTFTANVNEEADKKDVEWSVSDENIASIEVNGNSVKVIAKAKGQVTITAKATDGSEKSDSITIEVQDYKEHVVDLVKDIIDTNVVTPVNGSGQKDSPVQMEVKDVTVEEFNKFLNNIKKLNPEIQNEYVDGEFTVYQIKVKNNSLMSKFIKAIKNQETNEAYINIKIRNTAENSEKLKAELKKVLTEKDEEIVKPSIPGGIINAIPQIEASDKVINLGEKFEPLKGVIATDKEDGNITKNIKIIENTVNVNAVGTYKVTYKVTDSKGAEAIKTIIVTVKKDAVLAQSVTINNKINSLYVGSNKTFTATVNEEADKKDVEWSVSDENIASIEVNGNSVKVIAKAKGQVTITAKTTDGSNKVDTFTINVEEYKDNVVDFITDIIDTEVVSAIAGSGEKDSPLQMEVQEVSLEKFAGFLNNIKELDATVEDKYTDGNFIVYKIKVKDTSFISKVVKTIKNEANDEAYIEIRISKDLEEASLFEAKLEEVIPKNEDTSKPGDEENKPGDENKPGNEDSSVGENKPSVENNSENQETSNDKVTTENSKNDNLPKTGKRNVLAYIGSVTIAAGALLVGKKKKK
ncbi:immunoglobulin-like domain-containing protein [uncultured Clostridium sp.]|uniref:immunoglobulin-like domain-containing protein n=1 Tax=uncultured Clostridium sp. TaxID=59620 RepID=UPI002671D076|nr:immunoglobulin-like domain-containing protein [uncultured Clostridium sp.]